MTAALSLNLNDAKSDAMVEFDKLATNNDARKDDAVKSAAENFISGLKQSQESKVLVNAGNAIESMGYEDIRNSRIQANSILKRPLTDLSQDGDSESTSVANTLINLKMQIDDLNPNSINFSPTGLARILGRLPFIGNPVERYFNRFESASGVIDEIISSLVHGRTGLVEDNITMKADKENLLALTAALTRQIAFAHELDENLVDYAHEVEAENPERAKRIREDMLFPLRQRIMDLQQQQAVNQQAIMTLEVIIRNNNELIRGVQRAENVTVLSLQVAITAALALNNQKLVLDRVNVLNKTTSDLISQNARRLKGQGVEIQKQASGAMIEVEALKKAMSDTVEAIEAVREYRQKALPQINSQIKSLGDIAELGGQVIRDMEEENANLNEFSDENGLIDFSKITS